MLNRKIIINADLKGQTIEDGLYIKVQVRESIKSVIIKAFISAVILKVTRHMVNSILKDLNETNVITKKGRIYDVEA